MVWPAQLSDLNPRENLMRIIKIRLSKTSNSFIRGDAKVIQEEWDKPTEVDFRKYNDGMPKRCKLVILARGGFIKY